MDLKKITVGLSRNDNVYLAELARLAVRYEDMLWFMDQIVETVQLEKLNKEEKTLLFFVYKDVIMARATSWEILSSIEQNERSMGNADNVKMINWYMRKTRPNICEICSKIMLNLKSEYLFFINSVLPDKFKGNYLENQAGHLDEMKSNIVTDVLKICDELLDVLKLHLTAEPLKDLSCESMAHIFSNCFSHGGNIDFDMYLSELESGTKEVKTSEMSRKECGYMAMLARQAGYYNDMFDFMKEVVIKTEFKNLRIEEKSLWCYAYMIQTSTLGSSLRVLGSILMMEEGRKVKNRATIINNYMLEIMKEYFEIYALTLKLTNKAALVDYSKLSVDSYFQMHEVCHSYLSMIRSEVQKEAVA